MSKKVSFYEAQDILGPRPVIVFHRPHLRRLSRLWSSQLFSHNVAAIELQIRPSLINKQE